MAIDMSLISMKEGGKFAMSWLAGTNPKALRSNVLRQHIYSVEISKVCEEMIDFMETKQNKLSFRILFRLCFGTIHIFSEQVQHLYSETLNFVCFNNFVLKQYSRKRTRLLSVDTNNNKKRRLESSDSVDITSLLFETELFNSYSEEKFEFPNEKVHRSGTKQNTSTCIEIEKITIRQLSWENEPIQEEEVFGEASQDERSTLLSELSGLKDRRQSRQSYDVRKRKISYNPFDSTSPKRSLLSCESIDDLRYEPSLTYNETISEAGIDSIHETRTDSRKNTENFENNIYTNESTFEESLLEYQQSNNQLVVPETQSSPVPLENSIQIPPSLPEVEDWATNRATSSNVTNLEPDEDASHCSLLQEVDDGSHCSLLQQRKLRRRTIIDKERQISKDEIERRLNNSWIHCYDSREKNYLMSTAEPIKPAVFNKRTVSSRFQSDKLLVRFKNNLKPRLKHKHDLNKQLIVEEILGDNYEDLKSLFNIKSKEKKKPNLMITNKPPELEERLEEGRRSEIPKLDDNNNIQTEMEQNNLPNLEMNGCVSHEVEHQVLTLKCSLDEIDLHAISFNFPLEEGKHRSEWGKEGILKKLLFAWKSESPVINMRTIIVGANRINAALAFHTLLDLAGQQYIEILKDKLGSIESIKMGREMMRTINAALV